MISGWGWKPEVRLQQPGSTRGTDESDDVFWEPCTPGWDSFSFSTLKKYVSPGPIQRVTDALIPGAKIPEPSASRVQGFPEDFLDSVFHFGKSIFLLIFASYWFLLSSIFIIIFVLGHCLSVTQLSGYSGLWISLLFKAINCADLRIEKDFRKIHTFLSKIQRILTYFGRHLAWILHNILSVGKFFFPTLSYLKCWWSL